MIKLQKISRSNGTFNFSINIPLQIIEFLGWEKGDELDIETKIVDNLKIIFIKKEKLQNGRNY